MPDAVGALVDKISEYNVFNYLVPGSVFMLAWRYVRGAIPFEDSIPLFLLAAYFVGMVLSRVGSLMIEPVLLASRFLRFCDYGDFVRAEASDPKIAKLGQENNMYRSMTAVFAVLLAAKGALYLRLRLPYLGRISDWVIAIFLLLLFAFSHRKQSQYIVKRVRLSKTK